MKQVVSGFSYCTVAEQIDNTKNNIFMSETLNNSFDKIGQNYEIQKQLSKKTGRRTLLARDLHTGELTIIKLLAFNSDFEWNDLKLFEREADTLKSLSHPCIPRYLDYFEVNSPAYKGFALVQTYIPAQNLEQWMRKGRIFTEADIKQIAEAILQILIYLHGINSPVIHRDIKPSNILLGERSGNSVGQVYLIDFGSVQTAFAQPTASISPDIDDIGTRTVVGTYGYMPQEQFGGRCVPASDLYSLGATLTHLLTGIHPGDLFQKDLRVKLEPFVQINPQFANWLSRMIEPSLDKRFTSANVALQALNNQQDSIISSLNYTTKMDWPFGGRIQLREQENSLEIEIPPLGMKNLKLSPVVLNIAFFAITLMVSLIYFFITATSLYQRVVLTSFSMLILYIIYLILVNFFLVVLFISK